MALAELSKEIEITALPLIYLLITAYEGSPVKNGDSMPFTTSQIIVPEHVSDAYLVLDSKLMHKTGQKCTTTHKATSFVIIGRGR